MDTQLAAGFGAVGHRCRHIHAPRRFDICRQRGYGRIYQQRGLVDADKGRFSGMPAASGADTFISVTTLKSAVQSIRKVSELGWKPLYSQGYASASVSSVLKPAGQEISQGILSAYYAKDGSDPQWDNDEGMQRFYTFL